MQKRKNEISFNCVIDTNIIISALLKYDSNPEKIIDLILDGILKPYIDIDTFEEYIDVIYRKEFIFAKRKAIKFLILISQNRILIEARKNVTSEFVHNDDKKFYEILKSLSIENKRCYLITGNKKHFPNESNIVSPKELIEIINLSKQNKENE